jgi:diguanylate cyclase (GGDEF)-like protein/PAS domain S-box-containing protein
VSPEGRQTLAADQLLDVLDGMSVLMYAQDADGRIVHANRAACELVGKQPEEVVGKLPVELFDPVTLERWTEQNREVLRTGRPIDVEDGWGGRTHLTHKTPVFDSDGRPVGVIGISTDITDRKHAEDELRRRERHLSEAQQIAGVGSWHWDSEAGELTWSTELCRLFGLTPEEAPTHEDALLLVHEEDRERVREAGRAVLAGEAPLELDLRILRKDRELRVLHCRGGVGSGPDGSKHRIDGTCTDVTDLRRVEARLAEAQRLAQLGSWDWDVARDEITWSREMYRIFGEDPEQFVPTRGLFAERIVEEDYGVILEQVTRARQHGGDFDAFARVRQPDGQTRDVRFRGSMVTTPGSAGDHLLGICQDLTDVRRAEEAREEAVERFRTVFERAPVGMALSTLDGRFVLANEAMAEFLGRSVEAVLDCGVMDVTHPEDVPTTSEALRRMLHGELSELNAEKRYVRPTGEVRWGALRALLLYDADGRAQHCLALFRDVTAERLAERRRSGLHAVSRIMAGGAALTDALPSLVETVVRELDWERGALWVLDAHGELRLQAAWPPGSAPASPPPPPAEPTVAGAGVLIPVVSGADMLGVLDFGCEGTERLDADLASFAEALGVQLGEFLVRKRAEELLLHQALHDPLTGLPNRVLFFDRLDHAIRRLRREHAPLAVLFLDFDGFKAVNDRFGHAGGDEVLRRAADRVATALRAEDTVGRFGGDELVVLSEHVAGAAGAAMVAERILDQLRTPIELDGEQLTLSASIGICVAPVEGATRDALLHTADAAMYRAKAGGPGRYVIAEE